MKRMLVCFVGIDGSGKSTLAKSLVAALAEKHISSRYTYNRFQPLISLPATRLGKILFLRKKDRFKDYGEYSRATGNIFKNSLLSRSYQGLLMLDYFFQVMVRVKLPLAMGKNLICDRYIYDIVADIAVEQGLPQAKTRELLRKYTPRLPRPDLIFLIDVPEETAFSRKTDVPSLDYLTRRRQVYLDVSKENGLIVLDGRQSLSALESEIKDRVFAWMKR